MVSSLPESLFFEKKNLHHFVRLSVGLFGEKPILFLSIAVRFTENGTLPKSDKIKF